MLIGRMFIRRGMVVIQDIDGSEIEIMPEDAIGVMHWCYTYHAQLASLLDPKPPLIAQPRMDTIEQFLRRERGKREKGEL